SLRLDQRRWPGHLIAYGHRASRPHHGQRTWVLLAGQWIELTLADGSHMMGQMAGREVIPESAQSKNSQGKARVRIKIGNRDLYGLDFKWIDEDKIVSRMTPPEVVLLERREWGNMYGRIKA